VLTRLLDEVRPQLHDGAKEFAEQATQELLIAGSGAARQRAAFARGGISGL
jgi:carboxylate-amine ligase